MFNRKLLPLTTLNLVPSLLKSYTSCHILPRLMTSYDTLSPMFDRKLFPLTTLSLVPKLLKELSHLATSYHVLSHLITPYPLCLIDNYCH